LVTSPLPLTGIASPPIFELGFSAAFKKSLTPAAFSLST